MTDDLNESRACQWLEWRRKRKLRPISYFLLKPTAASFWTGLCFVCVFLGAVAVCMDITGVRQCCSLDKIKNKQGGLTILEGHLGCSVCLVCSCHHGLSLPQDPGDSECWGSCFSIFLLLASLPHFGGLCTPQWLCPHFRRYLVGHF